MWFTFITHLVIEGIVCLGKTGNSTRLILVKISPFFTPVFSPHEYSYKRKSNESGVPLLGINRLIIWSDPTTRLFLFIYQFIYILIYNKW